MLVTGDEVVWVEEELLDELEVGIAELLIDDG